jgi:hypothetical protein
LIKSFSFLFFFFPLSLSLLLRLRSIRIVTKDRDDDDDDDNDNEELFMAAAVHNQLYSSLSYRYARLDALFLKHDNNVDGNEAQNKNKPETTMTKKKKQQRKQYEELLDRIILINQTYGSNLIEYVYRNEENPSNLLWPTDNEYY